MGMIIPFPLGHGPVARADKQRESLDRLHDLEQRLRTPPGSPLYDAACDTLRAWTGLLISDAARYQQGQLAQGTAGWRMAEAIGAVLCRLEQLLQAIDLNPLGAVAMLRMLIGQYEQMKDAGGTR